MVETADLPPSQCPWCGFTNDSIVLDIGRMPVDGDVIWCEKCGGAVMVLPDGLRRASKSEEAIAVETYGPLYDRT